MIQVNSTVHHAHRLWILQAKDKKHPEEELENDIPENCARSLYEQ